MEETNTIEISVKGITTSLTFDKRTAELYQHQIAAVLQQTPNDFYAFAVKLGLATLVYCGYYVHCKDIDLPLIFSIEDFSEWAIQQADTAPGYDCINNITQIYLKLAEG